MMRKTDLIIKDIKELITRKGYIYALCMILFEDFHIDPEQLHEIDNRSRLSIKESSLLLGFLIQNKINFSTPNTPQDLINLKQKTYELMEELHNSFKIPFFEKLKTLKQEPKLENYRQEQKEFFGKGDMLIEPIFYSGTGVYDFQYLDFLEKKYKYDKDWLFKNRNFDIRKSKNIVIQIKNILQTKSQKIRLYGLKENIPKIIANLKKEDPVKNWEQYTKEILSMMDIYQYVELFFENSSSKKDLSTGEIRAEGWRSFYEGLIELFVIRKSDFDDQIEISSFLDNFSISLEENLNSQFLGIGSFNLINAKPIIRLDKDRYLVLISFLLSEAVYESPFYWMWNDKPYRDQLSKNRGTTGEEIAYDFLSEIFGKDKTFKTVKITTKKGQDDTDIDVLCLLGSKALCVQVKSKKLTEFSRTGNDEQLQQDFKLAVQDAYEQGLISHRKILEKQSKFFDVNGNEINLSEDIDDVYIMGITTENYPSLTHQTHVMIDKKGDDPYPIVLTIFDLELISYYFNDPYDFLYYIRQRTSLMDYFKADEEMGFLAYHLNQKLWKIQDLTYVL